MTPYEMAYKCLLSQPIFMNSNKFNFRDLLQKFFIAATIADGEGDFVLNVTAYEWSTMPIISVPSLAMWTDARSTVGAQPTFGSPWGRGAVLYTALCPAEGVGILVVSMVRGVHIIV